MKPYKKENLEELGPFELNGILNLTKGAIKHWANDNPTRAGELIACVMLLIGEFDYEMSVDDVLDDLQAQWRELAARKCEEMGIDYNAVINRKLSDFQK